MLLKKTCISSNNLSKNVHLKVFWTLFKNVHCRGPCSLRPCISRPYCIHLSSVQFLFVSSSHCNFPVHICSAVQYKAWNILVIFQAFAFTLRLKCIRARSLIMMTKFCPLLTTYLPLVYIGKGIYLADLQSIKGTSFNKCWITEWIYNFPLWKKI